MLGFLEQFCTFVFLSDSMLKQISRAIVCLVILIMTCECVSAAVFSSTGSDIGRLAYHAKNTKSSVSTSVLFEKAEVESERGEEERDKVFTIELADLSQIAMVLSHFHSPRVHFIPNEHRQNSHPPLFELFCILII
jgi:hypothetical protein